MGCSKNICIYKYIYCNHLKMSVVGVLVPTTRFNILLSEMSQPISLEMLNNYQKFIKVCGIIHEHVGRFRIVNKTCNGNSLCFDYNFKFYELSKHEILSLYPELQYTIININ